MQARKPNDHFTRLKLNHRGIFSNQLLDLLEIGRRVDEALCNFLLWVSKYMEHVPLLHDTPMLHYSNAVTDLLHHSHLMRDEHDRDAKRFIQLLQQAQNGPCGLGIQRGCCLVAQQHIRVVGQCSGNGDALLLSAGELTGVGSCFISDAYKLQQVRYFVRRFFFAQAAAPQRVGNISGNRAGRHQIKMLKDHPDFSPRLPKFLRIQCRDLFSVHRDRTMCQRGRIVWKILNGGRYKTFFCICSFPLQ